MHEVKRLSPDAVPKALEKAERYRLLNEPGEAESICTDILEAAPGNQSALVMLLLALTDQFEYDSAHALPRALEILPKLTGGYERHYYAGIICERRARARLRRGGPGSGAQVYQAIEEALEWYGKAEALRPPGNDDAILRWNTCVRLLRRHADLAPGPEERIVLQLE
jgi:hypothetical protein